MVIPNPGPTIHESKMDNTRGQRDATNMVQRESMEEFDYLHPYVFLSEPLSYYKLH